MDRDWILIWKMKQGHEDACEEFIRKYYPDILKYCHFHCFNQTYAEDLAQETFLKFFVSLPRYRHEGKAKNYLYTIAANLCRDLIKKPETLPAEYAEEVYWDPLPDLENKILVDMAVAKLPQEMREVILLHYYQGLTLAEAAKVLQIGLPLAKYRLKRAKELLRKETDDEIE